MYVRMKGGGIMRQKAFYMVGGGNGTSVLRERILHADIAGYVITPVTDSVCEGSLTHAMI